MDHVPTTLPKITAAEVLAGGVGLAALLRAWRDILSLALAPFDFGFRVLTTRNRRHLKAVAAEDWADEMTRRDAAEATARRAEAMYLALHDTIARLPDTVGAAVAPIADRVAAVELAVQRQGDRAADDGRALARLVVIGEAWAEENDERRRLVRRAADRIQAEGTPAAHHSAHAAAHRAAPHGRQATNAVAPVSPSTSTA